jgi:hypothetical protein
MPRRPTLRLAALLLLLPLLSGCALLRGSGKFEEATVVVENNLITSSSVTVYLFTALGARTLLGSVPPGSTRSLRYRAPEISGRYRLVARIDREAGTETNSPGFALSSGETLWWDLRRNTVVFQRL